MSPSFRHARLPTIGTHVLTMALGYAAWTGVSKPSHQGDGKTPTSSPGGTVGRTKADRDREGERSRQLTEEQRRGDALLAKIAGTAPDDRMLMMDDIDTQTSIRSLIARANQTPPARDPAARAKELLAADQGTLSPGSDAAVAMLHWLRADPDAAMEFLSRPLPGEASGEKPSSGGKPGRNNIDAILNGMTFLDAVVQDRGWEPLLKYLPLNTGMAGNLPWSIAAEFAKAPDMGKINFIKEASGEGWDEMMKDLARVWPQERAEDLLKLAVTEGDVSVLQSYVGTEDPSKVSWLIGRMAGMTEEMKRELATSDGFLQLLYANPQADFSMRVEAMSFLADEDVANDLPEGYFRDQAIVQDVAYALNHAERDWRYAFRNGEVTADEVLDEVRKLLPQQSAASADGVWRQVFHELAEENPQAAMKMLDDLPEDERHHAVLKAGQAIFNDVNPQAFYDFLQRAPHEDEGDLWSDRMLAWAQHTDRNHDRLGDAYVGWVESLPPGQDREMASYHLITSDMPLSYPDLRRLSENLTDNRLINLSKAIEFSVPDDEPTE